MRYRGPGSLNHLNPCFYARNLERVAVSSENVVQRLTTLTVVRGFFEEAALHKYAVVMG